MLGLFVLDGGIQSKVSAVIRPASESDFALTSEWQTSWQSKFVAEMPNKVALCRSDTEELLGLMSYEIDECSLAVEIIYMESAAHSNSNLLHLCGERKKYIGIARALFAYAAQMSLDSGFGGVVMFKAKTSELLDYYKREFGAMQVASYDPFRLVIWEDAAIKILSDFVEV
ncbi:hypothetical protein [Agathobaculum desmolans]|uniref:hypothetical protein n=1 Tax=Agathobaculum desmolans TaxID=39484 RepID=UPI002942B270|nr:hypothetical protein [Agathobaculum desmolans]